MELKQTLLSGIFFAVPLIVAGDTMLAVVVLLSQISELQDLLNEKDSQLWTYRKLGNGPFGILMVPVLAAYIVYSLANKLVLALGFVAGFTANAIDSGPSGAVVDGSIAGYSMRQVKDHLRLSSKLSGFLTPYLYPVLGMLGMGSPMLFVAGEPIARINNSFTIWLNGLSGNNVLSLGVILGSICPFDLRGPVNKTAYAFCLGAVVNGVYGPYAIFASVKMVSAPTVTAPAMLIPRLFKEPEIEIEKFTRLLGLTSIVEGMIPMAIEDPLRAIGSFVSGSMVTGAIISAMNIGPSTPGVGTSLSSLLHDNGAGGVMAVTGWFDMVLVGAAISTTTLLMRWRHAVKHGNYPTDGVML